MFMPASPTIFKKLKSGLLNVLRELNTGMNCALAKKFTVLAQNIVVVEQCTGISCDLK